MSSGDKKPAAPAPDSSGEARNTARGDKKSEPGFLGQTPPRPARRSGDSEGGTKPARFIANKTIGDAGTTDAMAAQSSDSPPIPAENNPEKEALSEKPVEQSAKTSDGEEEGWSGDPIIASEDSSQDRQSRKKAKKKDSWWAVLRGSRISVPFAAAGAVLFAALIALPVYRWGKVNGARTAEESAIRSTLDIPPEVTVQVDAALMDLRNGEPEKALAALRRVHDEQPRYPTVAYLVALAAIQAGDSVLAEKSLRETISRKERVSDALALRAVLESMPRPADQVVVGDPKVRAENYLRQAVLADPANASPRFELATLLRYTNRRDEARKEIRAAQARLNPVDAHTVTEATLRLMDLEDLSDAQLPALVQPQNLTEALANAYIAMRQQNFPQAAILLEAAKKMTNADIFYYLLNDPVLRRFRGEAQIAKFWE